MGLISKLKGRSEGDTALPMLGISLRDQSDMHNQSHRHCLKNRDSSRSGRGTSLTLFL